MSLEKPAAIIDQLFRAFNRLHWTVLNTHDFAARLSTATGLIDECWLRRLRKCADLEPDLLTEAGCSALDKLLAQAVQLLDCWPRRHRATTEHWLSSRLYLGELNSRSTNHNNSLNAIVSSQLGRNNSRLSHWPTLLNWAIRKTNLDNAGILAIPGSTLYDSTIQFAQAVALPVTQLLLPHESKHPLNLSDWLVDALSKFLSSADLRHQSRIRRIFMSPVIQHGPQNVSEVPQFDNFPLQDRAAIALADRVLAVFIKANGKIAGLLKQRLGSSEFPRASVFVAIPQTTSTPSPDFTTVATWLDQGAVGYLVMIDDSRQLSMYSRCRQRSNVVTLHVCCSLRKWLERDLTNWRSLAHCTRGNSGPVPQESTAGYHRRIWEAGRILPADPYLALLHILREGRIRGSTWLTRGRQPTVSLSRVPLSELLHRRRFQSHLGRWDWEPYGLLFNQRSLGQAKPVIYGSSADYEKISPEDRSYFQPIESNHDWTVEQEWRVVGDIDLRALSSADATVFTRSRAEAIQLAAHSPFPVIWSED